MADQQKDYSIRFGESVDKGLEPQKAFPFIYPFVQAADDRWEQDKGTMDGNMSGLALLIPKATTTGPGRRQIPIRLDPDYAYKLLWTKYSAYFIHGSVYEWYDQPANWFLEQEQPEMVGGTPLTKFLYVSLSVASSAGIYVYGGHNTDTIRHPNQSTMPISLSAMQGYDFGWAQLRSPYFVARSGLILIDMYNTSTDKDLYVAGLLYGMKVRI
jgi:hypothetical protein